MTGLADHQAPSGYTVSWYASLSRLILQYILSCVCKIRLDNALVGYYGLFFTFYLG